MNRSIPVTFVLALAAAGAAQAGTFASKPIAPEMGLDGLTRGVARQLSGRAVFANPYATVTISNVDVYDRFPYVESRQFQVVSDPQWNRLVVGEVGRGLAAFDGKGTPAGALSEPRGMAVDERNRVYVADTGNDRIVVLQASTEFEQVTLTPLFTVTGLNSPYDVAYSDGGTPFVDGDDALLVANTGRNEVRAYALENAGARETARVGQLGSGDGAFAGPMAVAFGRENGASTPVAYVADAHNRRLVELRLTAGALRWSATAGVGADVVTSLDTDHWGNVYAAAPQQGVVRKFNGSLEAVAELHGPVARPRSFRVPFSTIRDHRDGTTRRQGQPTALSLDQWGDASGMVLWDLGVSVDGLGVVGGDAPVAHFTLTDAAQVTLEVTASDDGRVLSRRSVGALGAGVHDLALTPADLTGAGTASDLVLRVSAAARYENGATASALSRFTASGSGVAAPARAALLGHWPNPVRDAAHLSFALPAGATGRTSLGIFDAMGRHVRDLSAAFTPGVNTVVWDGKDDSGRAVRAGFYFYRLESGSARFSRRLVVVR